MNLEALLTQNVTLADVASFAEAYVFHSAPGALSAAIVLVIVLAYVSSEIADYVGDSCTAFCIGKRAQYWGHSHEQVDYDYYGERVTSFPRGLISPLTEMTEPHVVVMRVSDGSIVAARVSPLLYHRIRPRQRLSKWTYRTLLKAECDRI